MKNTERIIEKEENFHDNWANSIDIDEIIVDELFEASTAPENRMIIKKLGNIEGKRILDLGCGAGEAAVYFAKKGADVVAVDLSKRMLDVAERLAEKHHVTLSTKQSSSDKIDFEDESFDIVYSANLLHHVDILSTLKEVSRLLKKAGLFVSWDPIAHNPIINVYRKMATEVRTVDEHPINLKQLKMFSEYFSDVETETTWFFTLIIFIKFYFIDRIHPNKERYWKKILKEHDKLNRTYYRLERLDRFFLKFFPVFRRYCWNIVIIARK